MSLFLSKLQKLFHCTLRRAEGLGFCDWLLFWKGKKITFYFLSIGIKSPVEIQRMFRVTATISRSFWVHYFWLRFCNALTTAGKTANRSLGKQFCKKVSMFPLDFTFKVFTKRYFEACAKWSLAFPTQGITVFRVVFLKKFSWYLITRSKLLKREKIICHILCQGLP